MGMGCGIGSMGICRILQSPPATTYTHACHAWEGGHNTHSKGIKEGIGGT